MLKPLIQIVRKLLRLKVKTRSVIIQATMESMRQSVVYYNSYRLKVGKLKTPEYQSCRELRLIISSLAVQRQYFPLD